jgi:hypothetical protein
MNPYDYERTGTGNNGYIGDGLQRHALLSTKNSMKKPPLPQLSVSPGFKSQNRDKIHNFENRQ